MVWYNRRKSFCALIIDFFIVVVNRNNLSKSWKVKLFRKYLVIVNDGSDRKHFKFCFRETKLNYSTFSASYFEIIGVEMRIDLAASRSTYLFQTISISRNWKGRALLWKFLICWLAFIQFWMRNHLSLASYLNILIVHTFLIIRRQDAIRKDQTLLLPILALPAPFFNILSLASWATLSFIRCTRVRSMMISSDHGSCGTFSVSIIPKISIIQIFDNEN